MSTLMMYDEKVIIFKDTQGSPTDIERIVNPELLPLSLREKCTFNDFKVWFDKRLMPENRDGIDETKKEFGTNWLKSKNYASLSDQYWLQRRDESWKKINFFTTRYSHDVGDILFSPWNFNKKIINSNSPDLTTGGVLKKRWKQNQDNTSFLVKAGNPKYQQSPLAEVLVSTLCEQIGVDTAGYTLYIEGMELCSACQNFVNKDTELVTADQIYNSVERKENETVYEHLIRMAEKYSIPKAKDAIDWMIFIDTITGNEDRNLGNIGFIRDAKTLKFIGPAPLFDCGNAYWNSKNVSPVPKSKLFKDIEPHIFKRMRRKCDFEKLIKNCGYKELIENYPQISDEKKKNLSQAIARLNEAQAILLRQQELDR